MNRTKKRTNHKTREQVCAIFYQQTLATEPSRTSRDGISFKTQWLTRKQTTWLQKAKPENGEGFVPHACGRKWCGSFYAGQKVVLVSVTIARNGASLMRVSEYAAPEYRKDHPNVPSAARPYVPRRDQIMNTTTYPNATPTEIMTNSIVDLYRDGQIEQGEELVRWAWGNRLFVTVRDFANVWSATNPNVIEQTPSACSSHLEGLASRHFGSSLLNARKNAMMLEVLSERARAGEFDRILGKAQSITKMIDLYQSAYDLITPRWVTHFAPTAMTPDEFEMAIYSLTATIRVNSPTCPACGGRHFLIDDGFTPNVAATGLDVAAICGVCDFPMTIAIDFV